MRKHGPSRRRPGAEGASRHEHSHRGIRAVEFTPSREGDSSVLADLPAQIPADQPIGIVTANGAYDTRTCHTAIAGRGGTAIIPIRKNDRP